MFSVNFALVSLNVYIGLSSSLASIHAGAVTSPHLKLSDTDTDTDTDTSLHLSTISPYGFKSWTTLRYPGLFMTNLKNKSKAKNIANLVLLSPKMALYVHGATQRSYL